MNKKIHGGEKNEIEYKGGRRQARREKGGGGYDKWEAHERVKQESER